MQLESLTLLDDIVQLRLVGRLDLEGMETINDTFSFAATERKGSIIVDLSDLTFLASIGIRMLVTSAKAQANRGGRLILAAPRPEVRRVIEASGVDQLIDTVADVESAIARLKGPAY